MAAFSTGSIASSVLRLPCSTTSITLSVSLSGNSNKFSAAGKSDGTLEPRASPRHGPDSQRTVSQRATRKRTSRKPCAPCLFFAATKLFRDRTPTGDRRPRESACTRTVCARSESLQSPRRTGSWSGTHTPASRTRLPHRRGRRLLSNENDQHVFGNHAQRIADVAKELRPARPCGFAREITRRKSNLHHLPGGWAQPHWLDNAFQAWTGNAGGRDQRASRAMRS